MITKDKLLIASCARVKLWHQDEQSCDFSRICTALAFHIKFHPIAGDGQVLVKKNLKKSRRPPPSSHSLGVRCERHWLNARSWNRV